MAGSTIHTLYLLVLEEPPRHQDAKWRTTEAHWMLYANRLAPHTYVIHELRHIVYFVVNCHPNAFTFAVVLLYFLPGDGSLFAGGLVRHTPNACYKCTRERPIMTSWSHQLISPPGTSCCSIPYTVVQLQWWPLQLHSSPEGLLWVLKAAHRLQLYSIHL